MTNVKFSANGIVFTANHKAVNTAGVAFSLLTLTWNEKFDSRNIIRSLITIDISKLRGFI